MPRTSAQTRLYVVVGILVLLLTLGGAVGTVLWLKQSSDKTGVETVAPTKEETEQARLGRQVEDARSKELLGLVATETDKQKKADYFVELAHIQLDRGNYNDAHRFANEAESLVKSVGTAALRGDIFYAQKDYKQAAAQYDLAMQRSGKTPSGERSAYNEYAIMKKKAEDAQ